MDIYYLFELWETRLNIKTLMKHLDISSILSTCIHLYDYLAE